MKSTIHNLQFTIIAIVFVLTSCSKPEWQLVWSDEFEAEELNSAYWNVENNARGGGNAELQYYAPKNVTFPARVAWCSMPSARTTGTGLALRRGSIPRTK